MKQKTSTGLSLREAILNIHGTVLNSRATPTAISDGRAQISRLFETASINPDHIRRLSEKIELVFPADRGVRKVRLRSSSNAEDNEKFNGAGLYISEGVKLYDSSEIYLPSNNKEEFSQKLSKNLKAVWVSVYGLRAYSTRIKYHLDESKVQMGLLVNQNFDETARGVAITLPESRNIQRFRSKSKLPSLLRSDDMLRDRVSG